jgi:hypothetical protein
VPAVAVSAAVAAPVPAAGAWRPGRGTPAGMSKHELEHTSEAM